MYVYVCVHACVCMHVYQSWMGGPRTCMCMYVYVCVCIHVYKSWMGGPRTVTYLLTWEGWEDRGQPRLASLLVARLLALGPRLHVDMHIEPHSHSLSLSLTHSLALPLT